MVRTMHWSFEQTKSPEFIKVTVSGDFSSTQFPKMLDELFSLDYWRGGIPLLFDYRDIDTSSATHLDLMAASDEVISRNAQFALSPIAAVVRSEHALETAERFGVITDDMLFTKVRRFDEMEDAVEWIASGCPVD